MLTLYAEEGDSMNNNEKNSNKRNLKEKIKIFKKIIFSYAIAAYIMYRIGKKRKWRPPSHFEIE